jgi:hypothetical protein
LKNFHFFSIKYKRRGKDKGRGKRKNREMGKNEREGRLSIINLLIIILCVLI